MLQRHLATFFGRLDDCGDPSVPQVPGFVRRELEDYLRCGQLAAGFARVFCPGCKRDELVALCRGRATCLLRKRIQRRQRPAYGGFV